MIPRIPRKAIRVCIPGGASHAPTLGGGLYELDKHFDVVGVAGVSAGGLNSLAYAFSVDSVEILRLYQNLLQEDRVLDKSLTAASRFGRCKWEVIGEAVGELLGKKTTLGEARLPIVMVVTDARRSRPVYLSSFKTPHVNVCEAAAATSALIPLASMRYIPSLNQGSRLFYDGGFTDNNPDHVYDSAPEPTYSFDLVDRDRDRDGVEDELPVREWGFDQAAMSVARSMTYAAGASKSTRYDRVRIPLRAIGSGLDFSLKPSETKARFESGATDVRTFLGVK